MTSLWQNLHNFYVSKFPNLRTFNTNGKENQIQNEIHDKIDEITNLWNELYPRIYGYFYRRINNISVVEDLTALTLSIFLENVQNGKIEKTNFGYLWQIARNSLFEYCRQKSKNFISLSDFDENLVDQKLANRNAELIEKIKTAAQKCLKNDEFAMFCDYYSSDLCNSNLQNLKTSKIHSNLDQNSPTDNFTNFYQRYNLKPSTLRQKIHRIKLKLQKEITKQNK